MTKRIPVSALKLNKHNLSLLAALLVMMVASSLAWPMSAAANNLVITASVAAKPTDFQLSIQSSRTDPIPSNTETIYTITYGWLPNYSTDIMVIQATWSLGQSDATQIAVTEYVTGSGTSAMGQFAPQVDTTNRTITWNISPVAPGADRQVSFKLKTNNLQTGNTLIPFTVSSRIIGPGMALPWQNVSQNYQAVQTPAPTPTITPIPTGNTITPIPVPSASTSATPTPMPTIVPSQTPGTTPTPPTSGPPSKPPATSRFPAVGRIPVVGPPIKQTLDTLDTIAHHQGAAVAVPTAAIAALPWLLTIIPTIASLLPNLTLWQLLSLTGLLFWRQRRHPWGVVYDAKTKLPLDPVLLTLVGQDGQAHQTISDIYGRYQFVVEPGKYTLRAEKTHYSFPSIRLANASNDEVYQDLYFGQPITVTDVGVVSFNIPMDPIGADWNETAKLHGTYGWQTKMQKTSWYVFMIGTGWSWLMTAFAPTTINLLISGLYILLIGAMLWYRVRHPSGTIYDSDGRPVAGAIITLYDLEHPQMSRPPVVTTSSGRYAFLTDKGNYQLGVARKNQAGVIWPVISTPPIKQTSKQGHIAHDIKLP